VGSDFKTVKFCGRGLSQSGAFCKIATKIIIRGVAELEESSPLSKIEYSAEDNLIGFHEEPKVP